MKTMEDAMDVCARERDNFYVSAYMIEAWLGEITLKTVAEYAEKRRAKDRKLQRGLAAHYFCEVFGDIPDSEFHHFFGSLARFGQYDDAQSRTVSHAYWLMSIECPSSTWPFPVAPVDAEQLASMVTFMRGMLCRLGEWIEAVTHAQTHMLSHERPIAFDPDPENRELAILGVQQRHFPGMDDFQRNWWEWHHKEAAERLSDPSKWSMVGKAFTDDLTTHQSYPALDDCIIMFWPLVRRYEWTYQDLMTVIQKVAPEPLRYPCERAQDLASYCNNVLGLRKSSKGRSNPNGTPLGYEIAVAMCVQPGKAGSS